MSASIWSETWFTVSSPWLKFDRYDEDDEAFESLFSIIALDCTSSVSLLLMPSYTNFFSVEMLNYIIWMNIHFVNDM